jgi:REP element-mobilizing transposase RayT
LSRKPIIDDPGGIYHLIQRGNNRVYIFDKKEDKAELLDLIRTYQLELGFECLGYVIMGNHYHLIIKRVSSASIAEIMHRINFRFARYYNQKNKRTGHVFENRYRGYLVNDDAYLLTLLRYIHQNPVVAKMCRKVSEYPWSSDGAYRKNEPLGLTSIDFILNIFSEDRYIALKEYDIFMDEYKIEPKFDFDPQIAPKTPPAADPKKVSSSKSLDKILKECADDKAYSAILSGSRQRVLTAVKKKFIIQALHANYSKREISRFMSISEAAVSKLSMDE